MNFRFIILLGLLVSTVARAQYGGSYSYAFLANPQSARVAALGGENVTLNDNDLSVQLSNPSALDSAMHRHISVNQTIYPGGANYGNFAYAHHFKKRGTWGFGVQYMAYGSIKTTDEAANVTGSMNPGDVAIYGGGAYQFGKLFSVGANLKFITSNLSAGVSVGMAGDLAASVHDPKKIVYFTIAAKNLGGQFKGYGSVREPIPFNLAAGLSFGFKELPLRFHFNFHHLNNWRLRYHNPADNIGQNLFDDPSQTESKSAAATDEFFRHVVVGVEANIKKIVFVEFAYNHQNRMEFKQETRRGLAGFSFGVGVNVKQIRVQAALVAHPLKQTLAQFTVNVNTAGFVKKKAN